MRIWALILLVTLVGCGSAQRDALRDYREAYIKGDYPGAAGKLKKSGLEKEPRSRLLLLMEQGRLAYAAGDLAAAVAAFTAGTEMVDAQYTKSATREGSKWLVNDRNGEFFGATYERSWLYYHLALSHWRIYQEGKLPRDEARSHLFSARAALLAWDSFFQEWQRGSGGKSLYRHDLAAKIVAGEVHEATGVRTDQQIALQLYKDAWKLLDTLSPAYAAYNGESAAYAKELGTKLNDDSTFAPPTKFRASSEVDAHMREFLTDKILGLTAALRAGELPQLQKQFGFTKAQTDKARQLKNANVVLVLEEGTISPKSAATISLGIKGLASLAKDPKTQAQIAQVGSQVMATFAVEILGLGPQHPQQVGQYLAARDLTAVAIHEAAIEFEVPAIPQGARPEPMWLVIKSTDGKEMLVRPWGLASPLEEVARQSLEEEAGQRIVRTGVRVATKHIVAIIAAMGIYQSLKGKDGANAFLAKMAAVGSYVAATKGIAMSERADTRAWATLPRALRVTDAHLAPGSYEVSLARKLEQNAPGEMRVLGKIEVPKEGRAIFTYLLPQM